MRAHPGFSSVIVEVERCLRLREQVLNNVLTYVLFYKNGDIGAQKKEKLIWIQVISEMMLWAKANVVLSLCLHVFKHPSMEEKMWLIPLTWSRTSNTDVRRARVKLVLEVEGAISMHERLFLLLFRNFFFLSVDNLMADCFNFLKEIVLV